MIVRKLVCAWLLLAALPAFSQSDPDALFKAAESGNVADIRKALAQGVSVNVTDPSGWTPLLVAAGEGKLAAVQALVKAGANVNAASKKGETALMAAVLSGNVAVVKYLLAEGADKNAATAKGLTAADIATQAKKLEISKLLTSGGGKISAVTRPVPSQTDAKEAAAVEAYQKGRFDEAVGLFKELVGRDSKNASALFFLAQSLDKSGQKVAARDTYERFLEVESLGDLADSVRRILSAPFKDCDDCPEMVVIPAGTFDMGPIGASHKVILKSYAIGKTEVTQAQWQVLMGSNPSGFGNCGSNCPADNVSWDDAKEFLIKLSAKTGKSYRLPSEAEWEYACRSSPADKYCGGDEANEVAWFGAGVKPLYFGTIYGNSGPSTNPVGLKKPNSFGLHDMSGNVWEWVEDCWNANYNGGPVDGSAWITGNCKTRVVRGGAFRSELQHLHPTFRASLDSARRFNTNGFRVVRALK